MLTATPPGVWASYRTGMLGATILLRRDGLTTVLPPDYTGRPASRLAASIPGRWGATTVYGGGALWLANESGVMARADPRTGDVRARTRIRQGPLVTSGLRAVRQRPVNQRPTAPGVASQVRRAVRAYFPEPMDR